jgi:acyl-CoA synthetase (AMP-forming)/AMP-acid ligase II
MLDLARRFRRSSKRTQAAVALAAVLVAAAVAAALLEAYGPALAAVVLLLAGLALTLVRENARLHRKLDEQHRELQAQHRDAMRYAAKADKRLRTLDARISFVNRTLDIRLREASADTEAASRRVLGAIESERFAAAERHHEIAKALGSGAEDTARA